MATRRRAGVRHRPAQGCRAYPQRRQLRRQARNDIAIGARVFHDKFGYGNVAAQEGNKLEIDFESAGRKRVIDSFIKLA